MTKHLKDLLTTNPDAAKTLLLEDPATSWWVKQTLQDLSQRDPLDVLFELDLLLNLFEAICDRLAGQTPAPHSRVRQVTETAPTQSPPPPLDQFPAEIEIGGTLDRLLIPEFLSVLHGASVCLSYDDRLFTPQTEADLLSAHDANGHLHFYNPFALEGEFLSLEDWLIDHQLGFRRTSAGTGTYQAERVEFRKGLDGPQRMAIDPGGHDLILREELRSVFRYLKEGRSEDATILLDHVMGVSLHSLPPFQIRDTTLHESGTLADLD